MQSILVTGGCGFIGSHLVGELVSSGITGNVVIVDNMMMSSEDNLDKEVRDKVIIYKNDVTDRTTMSFLLQKHRIDTVIHLAVTPLVMSIKEPAFTFNNIAGMQVSLLECQRQGLFGRLISFSTAEVYGDAGYGILADEKSPCRPRTTYAAAKEASDNLVFSYAATFGTQHTILRLVNNFGPRKRVLQDAGIIPTTIRRIAEKKPVVLFDTGEQTRNFLNVKDTIRATFNALQNPDANNELFLLADPTPRRMIDVVRDIYRLIGEEERIEYAPPRMGDVESVQANPEKAKRVLNFEPKISWEEGLKECVNYYLSHELV